MIAPTTGKGIATLDTTRIMSLSPSSDDACQNAKKENDAMKKYISVRVKSTHLTGSRYRSGIRFTHEKPTILCVDDLKKIQLEAIQNDPYLVIKDSDEPKADDMESDNDGENE